MYKRIGRRTRRVSDSKLDSRLQNRRRVVDADDDDDADIEIGDINLTPEEVQGLLELLPYKEALIKIAKGEFEIERVEETEEVTESEEAPAEETAGSEAEEENFEEDEDFSEENAEDEEDYEDYEEEDETEAVEDSAIVDAWSKRLKGNNK